MSSHRFKKQRTESEARDYVSLMRLRPNTSNLQAYKCKECGYWHVGHRNTPPEAKQAVSDLVSYDSATNTSVTNPPKGEANT